MRGADDTTAVVVVSPHQVNGTIRCSDGSSRWPCDGGVFAQIALRTRQLPLAWYSRLNPPMD